jgi:hypothetical protein
MFFLLFIYTESPLEEIAPVRQNGKEKERFKVEANESEDG